MKRFKIYNPLNSTFEIEDGITLKVVKSLDAGRTCTGCWYASDKNPKCESCYKHGHVCTPLNRKDRLQVVFKRIS